MTKPRLGLRTITADGDSHWTWKLSTEQLPPEAYGDGLTTVAPVSPDGTSTYFKVSADRALIDDLLDDTTYPQTRWDSYASTLRALTAISRPSDVQWSADQLKRVHLYLDRTDATDGLHRLAKRTITRAVAIHAGASSEPAQGADFRQMPGVPVGLGPILLDPSGAGVVLAPLGPTAPRIATAGRLLEELVWIASLIRLKSAPKSAIALKLARGLATDLLPHSVRLQQSTVQSFIAHVQRRLDAPLAPHNTVDLFWPAILQVIRQPSDVGLPWRAIENE